MLYGNKIFNNKQHFDQSLYIPNSIKIINGKEVEKLISLTLPSYVTSVDKDCLYGCLYIEKLHFPNSVIIISHHLLLIIVYVIDLVIPN